MRTLIFPALLLLAFLTHAQNGIIGDGFAPGWNSPADIVGFGNGVSGTRILITNPPSTGPRFFRLVRNWDDDLTQYGPFACTDAEWTGGANIEYLNMPACGNGAFFIDCPNTSDNYVFKTRNQNTNSFVYFRIQGAIRSVITVSTPVAVAANQPYNVDAELDGALSTGQQVYLRYTTDNYTNSTVAEMTGSGTEYSAQIPGFAFNTNVSYYVFTSGNNPSLINQNNADLYTININNNGGPNYNYTVQGPLHVSVLQFSAIEKQSDVHLSASIDAEKPVMLATFQKMNGEGNTKSGWMDIATILGPEFNSEFHHIDKEPAPGTNYYRLAITDRDGETFYSSINKVSISGNSDISVYPNPFRNQLFVKGNDDTAGDKIELLDLLGRIVFESNLMDSLSTFDVSGINQGTYLLQMQDKSGRTVYQQILIK